MNNMIRVDLSNALQVMTRDLKIRAFLEANDPKALEQAERALRAEYHSLRVSRTQSDAFDNAVAKGRFIVTRKNPDFSEANWIGNFAYHYSNENTDFFLNTATRQTVEVARE